MVHQQYRKKTSRPSIDLGKVRTVSRFGQCDNSSPAATIQGGWRDGRSGTSSRRYSLLVISVLRTPASTFLRNAKHLVRHAEATTPLGLPRSDPNFREMFVTAPIHSESFDSQTLQTYKTPDPNISCVKPEGERRLRVPAESHQQ